MWRACKTDPWQFAMPLELNFKNRSDRLPIDLAGLIPDRLAGLPLAGIERTAVPCGNERLPLAELFSISGDSADGEFRLSGDLSQVHSIAAGMESGKVRIDGHAGRHVGAEMCGGEIEIFGNASDWLAAAMRGGRVHVHGNAGDFAGAAYAGNVRGMAGGELLIDGDAGDSLGAAMRRGLIAVAGSSGDDAGKRMLAGTIIIGQSSGRHIGAALRRGTIAIMGGKPGAPTLAGAELLPTYERAGRCKPVFMRLLLTHLFRSGFAAAADWIDSEYVLFHGDRTELGRGEILLRA
jgi:formylmethanofuran dehydrogenase subunit C